MRLQPFADQLAGIGLKRIAGAIEWAGTKQLLGALPQGFVVPSAEAAGDNRTSGVVDQRVSFEFAVMLVLEGAARRDEVISEQLDELTGKVKDRLVGWKHPEASGPTLYVRGDLLSADGTSLVWALRFRSAYHLRKVG